MGLQKANHPKLQLVKIEESVIVKDPQTGESRLLRRHEKVGPYTLMAVLRLEHGQDIAVFENLQDNNGPILYVGEEGVLFELEKTLVPTRVPEGSCYRGHSKEEILESDEDILAQEILSEGGDPSYEEVAACLPPIRHVRGPHTFVGSRESVDAVPFSYSGHTIRVGPRNVAPETQRAIEEERIWEGLVGRWLPVVRFSYPLCDGVNWDMIAFGEVSPPTVWIQPVWYRLLKLENGELNKAHYFHSYVPYPWKREPEAEVFYAELLKLYKEWTQILQGGMEIEVPERWIPDLCRHSLVREMITRVGDHPRYGVAERYYGGPEHDGFPDTFTTSVNCFLEWGLFDIAKGYVENYLSEFIREDGSIEYRGPEIAQYGRMLTCLAQYCEYTADYELLLKYDKKVQGIVNVLMTRREGAKHLPKDDPAQGMIAGWDEGDICFMPDPYAYEQPYFSNSTEAWRGFRDLGQVWIRIGEELDRPALVARGQTLFDEAASLREDIHAAVERSTIHTTDPPCIPTIAGYKILPYNQEKGRAPGAFFPTRTYSEMLHSGVLKKQTVEAILRYCSAHRGIWLGVFGQNERIAGFTVYGQGYGLIQHDLIGEFLLFYYTHMAHCYTRGTWTAFEHADIDRDRGRHAPYCAPAQLTIPAVTKWMLVFEDPLSPTLWLAKATPRAWLESGNRISVKNAPTKWGKVSYEIMSQLDVEKVQAMVYLPTKGLEASLKIRLRAPRTYTIKSVLVNGKSWTDFDPVEETISLSAGAAGPISLEVHYQQMN